MHGFYRRQISFVTSAHEDRWRTIATYHADSHVIERNGDKSEALVKGGTNLGKQRCEQCAFAPLDVEKTFDQLRRIPLASSQMWREDSPYSCHPANSTIEAHSIAVSLRRCQQLAGVIDQGKSLKVLATPRGSQLRSIPLPVGMSGQPLIPNLECQAQDLIEQRSVGNDNNVHALRG